MIAFLLAIQLLGLGLLWRFAHSKGDAVVDKWFNPYCLLILFYILFFVLEQFSFLFTGQLIDGVYFPFGQDASAIIRTQTLLVVFVGMLVVSSVITYPLRKRGAQARIGQLFNSAPSPLETAVCAAFFVAGLAATLYLGVKFGQISQTGQFRSQLVKSADGQIATTISFFGNFAAAYFILLFVRKKQVALAVMVAVVFGAAILYTGSRGRLLWPLTITVMALFSSQNKFPALRLAAFAVVGFVILSMMDPLRKYLMMGGTGPFPDVGASLADIFMRRNFDGFANFNLIANSQYFDRGQIDSWGGAREAFMGAFFPSVYRSGVAFGATFPGYFYISVGAWGFWLWALIYGLFLGLLNALQRRLHSIWLMLGLWFALTWLAAVGGDLVESFEKLLATIAPAIALWITAIVNQILQRKQGLARPPRLNKAAR